MISSEHPSLIPAIGYIYFLNIFFWEKTEVMVIEEENDDLSKQPRIQVFITNNACIWF